MKKTISSIFNSLPKKLIAVVTLFMALVVIPFATSGAASVKLEGSIGVSNVTAGDTKYAHSVNASYDQVVKYQVFYHNTELPDSGKIAENLRVKIAMPTQPGKTQVTRTTISADNASNTVTGEATVNLNSADATLDFIPGSAVWRHNTGTNDNQNWVEQKISDTVVTSGQGLVIENEKPCYNFSATVTVLARVHVKGITVDKQVRVKGTEAWSTNNTAKPGDTLEYMISYKNMGNVPQNNVVIRDNLPPKLTYVPGTTYLKNTTNPDGVKYNSDNIASGGIVVGNYSPGAAAYVKFDVKIPAENQLACGKTEFRNVGVAKPEGMNEFYNTAITTVDKPCNPETPVYTCDALTVDYLGGRQVKATVKYTATNGATFKTADFNFGDSTANVVTSQTAVEHTYVADGEYAIATKLTFMVNGKTQTVSSDACAQTVKFSSNKPVPPTTPVSPETTSVLPNTGPGELLGLFIGISAISSLAYRFWIGRNL